MKILVIGGSGFIGSHILAVLVAAQRSAVGTFFSNLHIQVVGCGFEQLDVRDVASTVGVVTRVDPSVVIQVCGTKSVEYCAANPQDAWRIHVEGTRHVVEGCRQQGARLVYVSTDCVFDGQKSFYSEEDAIRPFNMYGRVKWEGERLVLDSGADAIVIRASLLFGWRQPGQPGNFVLSVLDSLTAGRRMSAATNLFNTPLEITQAAEAIVRLALSQHQGIFHVAGRDRISRYGFAVAVAETFGLDASLLQPVEDASGLRQPNSCLSVAKAEAALNIRFEGVKEGLVRMIQRAPPVQQRAQTRMSDPSTI